MRMIESDVIPLAFFEILLLDYLERNISEEELINMYQLVCQFSGITWRFESKLKGFIKRFWSDPYNKNEKEWMNCFCKEKEINAKERILELLKYMNLK
mgnify:FL=1